jgi:hypothetical protein
MTGSMGMQLRIHLNPCRVTRNVTDRQKAAQSDGSCQYYAPCDIPGKSLTQTTNSQFSCSSCNPAVSTAPPGPDRTDVFSSDGNAVALALICTSTSRQFITTVSTAACAILTDWQNTAVQPSPTTLCDICGYITVFCNCLRTAQVAALTVVITCTWWMYRL